MAIKLQHLKKKVQSFLSFLNKILLSNNLIIIYSVMIGNKK
ncbi:hypothetical protein NIES2100_71820 [Calothrix sp. NIES-2100]|nr:hypothetical protein NIES2100_71820 [Calothrix sp. NIES-2100]